MHSVLQRDKFFFFSFLCLSKLSRSFISTFQINFDVRNDFTLKIPIFSFLSIEFRLKTY